MKKDVKALVGLLLLGAVAVTAGCLEGESSGGAAGFRVAAVSPEADDDLEALDGKVAITFSADVDPTTITPQSIKVMDLMSHQIVPGKVTYDSTSRTATFIPFNDWMPDGHYKAIIHHRVQSSQGAKHLPATFTWEFGAPSEPPQLFHTEPYDGEAEVSPKTSIQVLFSGLMDAGTITAAAFQLIEPNGTVVPAKILAPLEGQVGHGPGHDPLMPMPPPGLGAKSDHAVLNPVGELKLNTEYTVKLSTAIKNFKGVAFAGKEWKFKTAATKSSTLLVGSDQQDTLMAISANSSGTYMMGTTSGAMTLANNLGGEDVFVTKREADGKDVWTVQFGTDAYDFGRALAVSADGTSFVVGVTDPNKTASRVPEPATGFITKVSPSGQVVQTVNLGATSGFVSIEHVISDGAGSLYVSGGFDGTLDGHASVGGLDQFLAKYNAADLSRVWLEVKGTAGNEGGGHLALGSNGSLYWAISTDGDFDAPTKKPMSFISKTLLFKFDTATRTVGQGWPVTIGGDGSRNVAGVGTDGAGNVYVGGTFYGEPSPYGPTQSVGFVVKVDGQSGAELSAFQEPAEASPDPWGGPSKDYSAMLVQTDGTVLLAGSLWGMGDVMPLPGGGSSQQSINSAYLIKVDLANASVSWSSKLPSKEHAGAQGLSVSPTTGDILMVGVAHGSFGGQIPAGEGDGFLAWVSAVDGKVK